MTTLDNRRPVAARSSRWAQSLAVWLAARGVSANAISVASFVFSLGCGAALVAGASVYAGSYLVAAALVPLRLLANLLDGLVAVEGGKATPLGPLYNEVPDRLSDVVILAALGHAAALAGGPSVAVAVGWAAATAAVMTAYIRELGRAIGMAADFGGPLAKQQRMWVVVGGAIVAAPASGLGLDGWVLTATVIVVFVGTALTVAGRLRRLSKVLREVDRSPETLP